MQLQECTEHTRNSDISGEDWFREQMPKKFLKNLVENLNERFEGKDITKAFGVLVPTRLSKPASPEYKEYGLIHIETLVGHFGKAGKTEDGKEHDAVVDQAKLKDEWPIVN